MTNIQRTCRYAHGALTLLSGWYALQGVRPRPMLDNPLAVKRKVFDVTGQLVALHVWRCPVCGYSELVDEVEVP